MQIWHIHSQGPSEQKPMKTFGEKRAWTYPGLPKFFDYPLLSQERCQVGCCLESWRTCLASCRPCAWRLFLACSVPRIFVCRKGVPITCIVLRVASSACLDVAIFVLANQVFWRLFCHVRLCCCLLVESECSLFVESWPE